LTGDAVRDGLHTVKLHRPVLMKGAHDGVRALGLYTDDPMRGLNGFQVERYARKKASSACRHQNGIYRVQILQDL
jgi:hypothetical protein